MNGGELRDRYDEALLSLLQETNFPSGDLLNRIEQCIDPRRLPDYVENLIERVEQERFPSPQMMVRINGLLSRLPAAS